MGTRSAIIVKVGNEYRGIYCHWDGYPEGKVGVGYKLHSIYNTLEKAKAIVALGSLSSLREKLTPDEGQPHTFETPQGDVTVAYHRDRGEKLEVVVGKSPDEVADQIDCAYIYVFRSGRWLVKAAGRKHLRKLEDVTGKET